MGLKIKDILVKKEIAIKDLNGKILAVDAMNILYQFLTSIRAVDGRPLTNSKGDVTSHLIGLFNRTVSLMEQGLKLCFVFDGKAPDLKMHTWDKRAQAKNEASVLLKQAEEEGNVEDVRKYAIRTVRLTKDMIKDAKELLTLLGIPIVQSPSEGEAQAAYMVKQGDVYASVSQDYDNLLFGSPVLIRNLSIAGRKKKVSTLAYETIKPEIFLLEDNLNALDLSQEQFIVLAILVGTDYNPSGIKGIGQKKALKLVKEYNGRFDELFEFLNWKDAYDIGWREIFDTIKDIPVTDDYTIEWKTIDKEVLVDFLVTKHEFSEDRVRTKIDKLLSKKDKLSQTGLASFM